MAHKNRQQIAPKQSQSRQLKNITTIDDAASPETDDRSGWIAQGAYLKAEARGFQPGHELEDWLAAEAEFAARRGH